MVLAGLDLYFSTAGVPLGADLFAYSWQELRMTAAGERHGRHRIFANAVELRVTGRQPGVHLHRQQYAVGAVVALDRIGQGVHVHRPGGRGARLRSESGIAVPAQCHEHMIA